MRLCFVIPCLLGALHFACACGRDPLTGDDAESGFSGEGTSSGVGSEEGEPEPEPEPEPLFEPCDGDPRAAGLAISPVQRPLGYALPSGPTVAVEDTPGLLVALGGGTRDIVLVAGDYLPTPEVEQGVELFGHRLWSETLGGARVHFGLRATTTGDDGAELHGLRITPDTALYGAAAATEAGGVGHYAVYASGGGGAGFVVQDTWIDGQHELDGGLRFDNPSGLRISRVELRRFNQSGIEVGNPAAQLGSGESNFPAPELSELLIDEIGWFASERPESVPLSAQCAMRIRDDASVSQVRIREVGYKGIEIGGRVEWMELDGIDIDGVLGQQSGDSWEGSAAVSLAENSRNVSLQHFCVGSNSRIGVNGQWYGEPIPSLHAVRPVISHGLIDSQRFGVHFDAGSVAAQVFDLRVENYSRAGIVFFQNLATEADLDTSPIDPLDPDPPNPAAAWQADASQTWDIEFAPACPGVPALSYAHWNSHPICGGD